MIKIKESKFYIHAAEILNVGGILTRVPLPVVVATGYKFMTKSRALELVRRECRTRCEIELLHIQRRTDHYVIPKGEVLKTVHPKENENHDTRKELFFR